MNTWFHFTCPGRYCELVPEDMEESRDFLKMLISQGLDSYSRMEDVYLEFLAFENTYIVDVHLQCYLYLGVMFPDWETMQPKLESIISHMLLQCFWEVHALEY